MQDVHNLVFNRLTSLIYLNTQFKKVEHESIHSLEENERCSLCNRPINAQPEKFGTLAYVGKNSYGKPIKLCLCCHAFFASDVSVLGVEKVARPNTSQKWGMLAGSGAFIDLETDETLLFMPKKSSDKIPHKTIQVAEQQYGIQLVNLTGIKKQLQAIIDHQPTGKCIWISNFGRKTDVLIRNLAISEGIHKLIDINDSEVNSSTEALRSVDLTLAVKLSQWFKTHQKAKTAFVRTLTDYINGTLSPASMMSKMQAEPLNLFAPIMRELPIDPHARLKTLKLAQTL